MSAESASQEQIGLTRRKLYFLYHELRTTPSEYSYINETGQFQKQVELFGEMRKLQDGSLWPEITFDDGHISNVEYALPILQSKSMTARFFITVGWTGKKPGYMGWQELRFLHQSGQLIGAHGWSHTLLTHCTERDLDRELGNARLTLEDNLGASVKTMSLPGGRYNQRVLAACRLAGYTQIFSSIPRAEQAASGFLVGRVNVRGDMALEGIGKLLLPGSTMLSRLERQYRIKCAAKTMLGDKLYERLWAVLNRDERQSREDGEYAE